MTLFLNKEDDQDVEDDVCRDPQELLKETENTEKSCWRSAGVTTFSGRKEEKAKFRLQEEDDDDVVVTWEIS